MEYIRHYTKEEIYESTLKYFDGDELAANVWVNKYALKDQQGNFYEKDPSDMHRRLAKEFARIEANYSNSMTEEEIFSLFDKFRFVVPQGSPMFGIGNPFSITSLSNCFVIGDNDGADSYGSIMRTDEEQIQLMKRRGGVGHDISHLRPSGSIANNAILKGISGATLYMERFSNSTREVSQGDRRGALMLSIDVRHPDADKFIDMKMQAGKVTGANISVKINDEFMQEVEKDGDFWQCFPIDLKIPTGKEYDDICVNLKYDELTTIPGGYLKKIKARKLWDKLIYNSWKSAEPGILFWDNFKRESTSEGYEGHQIKCVNPCAEICLPEYDSCRLMAMNLYSYVKNPFADDSYFDYDLFVDHVAKAQRLMDDLVDLEIEKIDSIIDKIKGDKESLSVKSVELNLWYKIRGKCIEGRRTGLGITGEGDMLAALGVMYGSEESLIVSENIHRRMAVTSYLSSIQMAKERSHFPIWNSDSEMFNPFIERILIDFIDTDIYDDYLYWGRRNIANLTIAPTGTLSILTQTTSGIEPAYKIYYTRRKKTNDKSKATFIDESGDMWEEFKVFHHKFVEWFRIWNKLGLSYKEALSTLIGKSERELSILIEQSPYYMSTSDDVDYMGKVKLQGRIQKWVDHSISVTVNMPENVDKDTVSKLFKHAYDCGCKGLTVYRDKSRSGVLVSNKSENIVLERPKEVSCDINHLTINNVKWVVLIGIINDKPYEVFALKNADISLKYKKGKLIKVKSKIYDLRVDEDGEIKNITGEFDNPLEGALTRQISLNLKHSPLEDVYIQLQKEGNISDFNKAISRVFKKYLKDKELKEICPECGSNLYMESGCVICKNCGQYSKCG